MKDLYAFDPSEVQQPPRSFGAILRRIGPGMILAASIVGSGELIATTTLGAEVGFVCIWLIVISCLIKPAIQSEIGRYSIATGETGLAGFNRVPGPRIGVNWIVWGWVAMITMTRFQIGAMFGGVAQVLNQLMPAVPIPVFVILLLALTLVLLLGGGYERVEHLATIKVCLFTMLTLLCAVILILRPGSISMAQIAEGFQFKLPPGGFTSAVAVFGITGVGASELFMYPYWCVEKGYARYTGKRDGTTAWQDRAFGWIKVMNIDILASMIIYTIATIAFYLLGAGILHSQGLRPQSADLIPVLSRMYTETLGGWSIYLFYVGAIATLYGTIFAATAAESRVAADLCRLLGRFEPGDYQARLRYRRLFVWVLTCVSAGLYLVVQSPVNMVKAGGVAQAIMLPVIALGALFLRYRELPKEVAPKQWVTVGLWVASLTTIALMAYYATLLIFRR